MKKALKKAAKKIKNMLPSAWPSRAIVRFAKAGKSRNGKPVQFAFMECGHKRKVDMTSRTHLRCRKCKVEGPAKKFTAKKKTATLRKAA